MARNAVGVTLGQQIGESTYNTSGAPISTAVGNISALDTAVDLTVTDSATMQGTLKTNVANAVGVLVADAASPTQAHVTTLNTAWGLLSTAMTTVNTDALAAQVLSDAAVAETSSANLVVDYDAAIITNMNQLRAALRSALLTLAGSGAPTL